MARTIRSFTWEALGREALPTIFFFLANTQKHKNDTLVEYCHVWHMYTLHNISINTIRFMSSNRCHLVIVKLFTMPPSSIWKFVLCNCCLRLPYRVVIPRSVMLAESEEPGSVFSHLFSFFLPSVWGELYSQLLWYQLLIPYEIGHADLVFSFVTGFTQSKGLWAHSHSHKWQDFITFMAVFLCIHVPHFLHPFIPS